MHVTQNGREESLRRNVLFMTAHQAPHPTQTHRKPTA